ncbi:MAG: ATP-binding protein, partial [Planctomycetales bacterium]|nr:ATP-binding protein [Planctomycetales bacterium]
HSMLALYHLFSGAGAGDLPGVDELINEEGLTLPEGVRRSVFVGTQVSPGKPSKKPDGITVRTLWGEIAWQLGGKEAFKMVQEDDKNATNPGDTLKKLFEKYGPCLILIDEWIAYARQLHTNADLPAGSFDTQFTFAQALTEAAKAAKTTLLVVSIPASESPHQKPDGGATHIEIGGEKGFEALERLKNAIGRVEASWRPASPDEGFEIVRRRLFEPLTNDQSKLRDTVARAFVDYYGQQQQEFPSECREAEYERRIQMAYPIHPELFDRLYNDWSTLEKFQRTRGVLRLMATVIHSLWERNDSNLLILPGAVPIEDPAVQFELTRYLPDQWAPVIEKDVDGPNSLPLALDREFAGTLGRLSACRRVSRTIYMGSAPIPKAANRGVDEKHVKLGCVQPGEAVATFGDAIRRLTDRGTYLYVDGKRYWFSTQPTVNRLADDRANQYSDDDIEDEIKRRLKAEAKSRGDFRKVHPCEGSGDIPDETESALVILGPEYPHRSKQSDTAAQREAAAILDTRGTSPRNYKNSLVFVAPDANRLRDLAEAVRQWKAWNSICDEQKSLNLDPFQSTQAESKRKTADETVAARIPETFQWLLVPVHRGDDPKAPIEWEELKLGNGGDSLAKRAIKKLTTEEHFFPALGSARLRLELDRVPLWRGNHVPLKQLCEDFARYLYLPRLRDQDVLLASIRDGIERLTWADETFAYAERYDEATDRYIGLRAGGPVQLVIDNESVLVRADVAQKQKEDEAARAAAATAAATAATVPTNDPTAGGAAPVPGVAGQTEPPRPAEKVLDRFHGSVRLDALRLGRDASRIAEEVVQHLSGIVGAEVQVTLEMQVKLPEGASEKLVRDVTENCRTLKFDSYGFEES